MLFSGLLRPTAALSPLSAGLPNDGMVIDFAKMYCDDFRDALEVRRFILTSLG